MQWRWREKETDDPQRAVDKNRTLLLLVSNDTILLFIQADSFLGFHRHVEIWQQSSAKIADMLSECCSLVGILPSFFFFSFVKSLKLGQRSAQSLCTNKKTDGRACWTVRVLPWPLESHAMWDWRVVWWMITRRQSSVTRKIQLWQHSFTILTFKKKCFALLLNYVHNTCSYIWCPQFPSALQKKKS